MILVPFIIAIFFIVLIVISPCVIKCIFKYSSFVGYCIGVCYSFITFLVILACSIGAALLVYEITKDEAEKINRSTTVYRLINFSVYQLDI